MSIEAMKQALEALISSTGELRLRLASPTDAQLVKNEAAITALRAAIAEASMQRLTDVQQEIETAVADQATYGIGITLGGKRIDPASIYKEQEMDCYGDGNVYRGQRSSDSKTQTIRVQEPVAWKVAGEVSNWSKDFSAYQTRTYVEPVYAHPPRREWAVLTDEEISGEFYKFEAAGAWYQFARAIETKLKEKNS